ncbi:MAG TPA: glycosyltransferase family 1 protein [Pyrinomonadaceae bacterium]|nr:glycosyltransferase family 1 protein [Pyrinomonadaceae bacterium]
MRIGLDGIPLTALKTGVGHYTFELACALAGVAPESSFEVVYPSNLPPVAIAEQDASSSLPANLKIKRVRVGPLGRYWWSTGLPRYVRSTGIELFHGTNYDVPPWRQCATVLTIHDLSLLIHPETHETRRVSRSRRRLPLMARAANAVIVPTESVRSEVFEYLGLSGDKVFAVPEAARTCFTPMELAETEAVRRRLEIGDDFLLAVGTIEPRKNFLTLVSAFEELARQRPLATLQLVIAGSRGWLNEPFFTALERSPMRKLIILTEYLNDEELRALYSSCRAFVYPSIYEGFGLPPLEAMACGAPVVTSRIRALEETTGGAAILVEPTNVEAFAAAIADLLDSDDLRSKFSALGRSRAAEFTWERTARLTLDVYEKAQARRRRKRSAQV